MRHDQVVACITYILCADHVRCVLIAALDYTRRDLSRAGLHQKRWACILPCRAVLSVLQSHDSIPPHMMHASVLLLCVYRFSELRGFLACSSTPVSATINTGKQGAKSGRHQVGGRVAGCCGREMLEQLGQINPRTSCP